MADYNSSYTGVQIDTAVGNALNPDAAPTSGSNQLVKSGGVYSALQNSVPVYGMGDNLLDNWYFVGGGTGRGVFPINQRGAISISTSSGYPYFIDRWYAYKGSSGTGYASLDSTGVYIYRASGGSSYAHLTQVLPTATYNFLSGKKCTVSVLLSNGFLYSKTATITAGTNTGFGSESVGNYSLNLYMASSGALQIRSYADSSNVVSIKAVKLEIGIQQTLCHNEGTEANPVWVLNDVPNYEDELNKCIIQPIEGSSSGVDTYANKNLATTQQLAPIETGLTASQNYIIGDLICWNNLLYKASSAIASGDTLAVGTNLTATTIEDEIEAVSTTGVYYGTCTTPAATPAKVATVNGTHTTPPINIRIHFTKDQGATSPTLNVNGTGAYPIRLYSITTATTWDVPINFWAANAVVDLEFSTTNECWIVVGKSGRATTTYYGLTKLEDSISSTSTSTAATPNSVKTAYDLASGKAPEKNGIYSVTCNTAGDTKDKTVSITGDNVPTAYYSGLKLLVYFAYAQDYNATSSNKVTLAANSLGAKPIFRNFSNSSYVTLGEWDAGQFLMLSYSTTVVSGGGWIIVEGSHASTTYYGLTKLNSSTSSSSTSEAATPSAVKSAYDLAAEAVPQTRTVNGKALSSDITLSASDVSAVPTTRTVNGKALSSDISLTPTDVGALAVDGTAVSASTLASQYTCGAVAGGWYQFLTLNISSASDSKKIILLIEDGYTSTSGILSIYYNRTTSGLSHGVYWLTTNMNVSDVRFIANTSDAENNSLVFYIRKRSNTNGRVTFRVLSSMTRSGTPYSISNAEWSFTSVSEPTTASTPSVNINNNAATATNATNDGNGNQIDTTYETKIKSGTISFPLSWGSSDPHTQTVTVEGVTITSNSQISLQPTAAQLAQLISDGVSAMTIENNSGTLTAYALGNAPTTAMTIACTVTEVS